MDSKNNKGSSSMSNSSSQKDVSEKSTSAPTVLFFWIWNWVATIPKTISNLYTDMKNGDLLSRFTLLDAMLQFIVAVATSCHPQEEGMTLGGDTDEHKADKDKSKEFQAFGGSGRTLRSRTAATSS